MSDALLSPSGNSIPASADLAAAESQFSDATIEHRLCSLLRALLCGLEGVGGRLSVRFVGVPEPLGQPYYVSVVAHPAPSDDCRRDIPLETQTIAGSLVVETTGERRAALAAFDARWPLMSGIFVMSLEQMMRELVTTTLNHTLDSVDVGDGPCLMVNGKGRLVGMNAPGRTMLEADNGLRVAPDGRLRLHDRARNSEFEDLLARLVSDPGASPLAMRIDTMSATDSDAMADDETASEWLVLSVRDTPGGADGPRILVRIKRLSRNWTVPPHFVARALGLTTAEAHLVAALVCGASVKEYAQSIGRRENTIRWHIANVLGKTGLRSQREVVQLVLRLMID
jgi:DNA-binding CsgD family transcriptional regulator